MRSALALLLLVGLIGSSAAAQGAKLTSKDEPSALQDAAVAAIKRLGGRVILDTQSADRPGPDRPATGVELVGPHFMDAYLVHLAGLTSVQTLDLTNAQVTDAGIVHLKRLTSLQVLHLGGTKVTDDGLVYLKGLTSLEALYLTRTQVTDAGLEHLKGLKKLQTLYLVNTNVTGAGLEDLKELTNLQRLYLTNTKVADAGLTHLKGLTSLLALSLYVPQVLALLLVGSTLLVGSIRQTAANVVEFLATTSARY